MGAETNDEAMIRFLSEMSEENQEHFKNLVRMVAACYAPEAELSAVMIFKRHDAITMYPICMGDMEVTDLVISAAEFMTTYTMQDAPPKDKFN